MDRDPQEPTEQLEKDISVVEKEEPPHPIASAINRALHRYRDIEAVARIVVPMTARLQRDMVETVRGVFQETGNSLADESTDGVIDDPNTLDVNEALIANERLNAANLPETLATSLFLGLFSAYDAYIGNLLQAIYQRKPELMESLNVEVPLSELLRFDSLDDLKESILLDEIENFRRKSYVEQFQQLENRFGISTLRKFDRWGTFVEVSQRRNLITHCGGSVSKQYLKICRENGAVIEKDVLEGHQLKIRPKYLLEACSLMYEVSLKLGQTLWRKIFPEEYDAANLQLTEPIYEALQIERWDRAILISQFANSVQKTIRAIDRQTRTINWAIALKFSGDEKQCNKLLASEDWSASLLDFRLAVEVLHDRFDAAADMMRLIGKESELISQHGYQVWPLFRHFRKSDHFLQAYEQIYGTSFAVNVAKAVTKNTERSEGDSPDELDVDKTSDDEHRSSKIPLKAIKHLLN